MTLAVNLKVTLAVAVDLKVLCSWSVGGKLEGDSGSKLEGECSSKLEGDSGSGTKLEGDSASSNKLEGALVLVDGG